MTHVWRSSLTKMPNWVWLQDSAVHLPVQPRVKLVQVLSSHANKQTCDVFDCYDWCQLTRARSYCCNVLSNSKLDRLQTAGNRVYRSTPVTNRKQLNLIATRFALLCFERSAARPETKHPRLVTECVLQPWKSFILFYLFIFYYCLQIMVIVDGLSSWIIPCRKQRTWIAVYNVYTYRSNNFFRLHQCTVASQSILLIMRIPDILQCYCIQHNPVFDKWPISSVYCRNIPDILTVVSVIIMAEVARNLRRKLRVVLIPALICN